MKKLISILFFVLACTSNPTVEYDQIIINYEGEEILVGPLTLDRLSQEDWFAYHYDFNDPNTEVLNEINDQIHAMEITVFLGTWCSDSREQLPGFIRMLKYLAYDLDKLKLIGLEKKEDRSMVSPGKYEEGKNITHVPTFIFYISGQEIGRIVEFPEKSLEEDMVRIIKGARS